MTGYLCMFFFRLAGRKKNIHKKNPLLLVQILTTMQPLSDLERLPFGADGGGVGGQVARGGDQRVGSLGRAVQ